MEFKTTLIAAGAVRITFETPKGTRKAMARFTNQGDWAIRLGGKLLGFAASIAESEALVARYVEEIRKRYRATAEQIPQPTLEAGYTDSIHSTDGKLGQHL